MDLQIIFNLLLISCISGAVNALAPRDQLGNPHIIGGKPVAIEEVPYQLSIRKFSNHICGASLIGKYYVLTAAHCFYDSTWTMWYGVSARSHLVEGGTYKYVRSITLHPKYLTRSHDYDVAVVRLWRGLKFDQQVLKIDPVPPGTELVTGKPLTVSGWGKLHEASMELSKVLMKVEVQVIEQSICKKLVHYERLTDRMFCAGVDDGSKDACGGDSGGPIVDRESGYQVGIVSWGIGCANARRPGVYTNLSNPEIHQFVVDHTKF